MYGTSPSCTTCPAGSSCASGVTSPTACGAGTFALAGYSSCLACPAGYYCASTSAAPTACGANKYCPAS